MGYDLCGTCDSIVSYESNYTIELKKGYVHADAVITQVYVHYTHILW